MNEIHKRIFNISLFRLVIVSIIWASVYLTRDSLNNIKIPFYFYLTIYFSYLFSFFILLVTKYFKILSEKNLVFFSVLFDISLVTVIVYSTKEFFPTMPLLYIFIILYSSLFYDLKKIILVTVGVIFSFIGLNSVPIFKNGFSYFLNNKDMLLGMEVHILGFSLVGILSGILSERVKVAKKRIAEQLVKIRNLEEYNEYILSSLQSGLLTTDRDFRVVKINDVGKKILGVEDLTGRDIIELLNLDRKYLLKKIEKLKNGKVKSLKEEIEYFKNGKKIFLGISISLLLKDKREVVGYIFVFQDITELRKMQQQLEIQRRMSAIGNLSAAIAHEIKNPLASLMGSIQVLGDSVEISGDERKLMNIILRESKRLNSIVNKFLQFAENKKFKLEKVNIVELLKETLFLLENSKEKSEKHKIVLTGENSVFLECDPDGMKQIYWNLITNALKAMPDGGILEINFENGGDFVKIEFRDTGIGMNSDELSSIFEPYSSFFERGSGLGMSIVYNLVKNLGGTIDVYSEKNRGTTVILNFKKV